MLLEGIENENTTPPTRKQIAEWSVTTLQSLSTNIVKKSWRHGNYSWFHQDNSNA